MKKNMISILPMNKFIVLFFLVFVSITISAQKLYVWCPDEIDVKPRPGFLQHDTINLVIFDGRTLPNRSKVECESSEVISSMVANITKAYPSAIINVLGDSGYYSDPMPNRITIKIGISAYQAGFGVDVTIGIGSIGGNVIFGAVPQGQWNGITGYYVRLYDYRKGKSDKFTTSISKIASKPNMGGYMTAKHCLNTTFSESNQDLLFFIDNSLMK